MHTLSCLGSADATWRTGFRQDEANGIKMSFIFRAQCHVHWLMGIVSGSEIETHKVGGGRGEKMQKSYRYQ